MENETFTEMKETYPEFKPDRESPKYKSLSDMKEKKKQELKESLMKQAKEFEDK
jgi:hypothetical protein